MNRLAVLAAAALVAHAQDHNDLRWTVSITPPALSNFQRLLTRISIRVDGKEISDRGGKGEFVFYAAFRDSTGKTFRTRRNVDLQEYAKANSRTELECLLYAFVLPGTYDVTLAVVEPATRKRSETHRVLRVPGLNPDPMPELWRGLPAVEFVEMPDPPDRWFLPSDPQRLSLRTNGEARIEVLANISPSEALRRQRRAFDRNMDAIIPALKILSEVAQDVAVIDISRRRVDFEQHSRGALNWVALREALEDDSPNKIDVGALRDRGQNAEFFAEQTRRMASGDGKRIVIVMSAPMAFASHQDVQAIEPVRNARVYYLRFQTIPLRPGRGPFDFAPVVASDDLGRALKPLGAKVIDLRSPLDFRKALASILKEINL